MSPLGSDVAHLSASDKVVVVITQDEGKGVVGALMEAGTVCEIGVSSRNINQQQLLNLSS
jgi:hypothetical protein